MKLVEGIVKPVVHGIKPKFVFAWVTFLSDYARLIYIYCFDNFGISNMSMTYLILCPIFHLSEVDINGFTVFTWSTLIATLRLLRILVQVGTPTYQCCKVFQCCLTTPNSNLIHTLYQAHNIHIYIYMLWVDVYGVLLCVCVCVCKDWVRVLAWPRLIVMLLCVLVLRCCSLIRQVLCSNN